MRDSDIRKRSELSAVPHLVQQRLPAHVVAHGVALSTGHVVLARHIQLLAEAPLGRWVHVLRGEGPQLLGVKELRFVPFEFVLPSSAYPRGLANVREPRLPVAKLLTGRPKDIGRGGEG